MSEMQRLLTAYDAERQLGRACALATVVEVNGSAYRRPGARMLVTADGQLTGTISGGCLEGDARRRAQQVMHRGKPEIIVYDSTDIDDDLENGAQSGCQGQIFILLEPIDFSDDTNPLELLRQASHLQEIAVLATILKSSNKAAIPVAQRLLLLNDSTCKSGNINGDFVKQLLPDMQELLAGEKSVSQDYEFAGINIRVFVEAIKPAPLLTIYGAGNDVQPLTELGNKLGWHVTVIDGRPMLATAMRFPCAAEVVVSRIDNLHLHVKTTGFAVLMSHNYHYDLAVLEQLSRYKTVNYIGILGPRKKTDLMLNDLEQKGIPITDVEERIHSPVGLDIGGENADEIAIAIMAELLAVRNSYKGGFLRNLDAPIHDRRPKVKS